jgi:hypothetical protein
MKTRLVVTALLLSAGACAQSMVSASGGWNGTTFSGSATFSPQRFTPPAVIGAPYSGEEVNEGVQTLSDGTHITQKMMPRKVWRDSQGRTRVERPLLWDPNRPEQNQATVVEITDPVGGFHYILDTQNKVAHRMQLQPPPNRAGMRSGTFSASTGYASAVITQPVAVAGGGDGRGVTGMTVPAMPAVAPGNAMRPDFKNEPLGSKLVDGVLADGQRSTLTYPTGMMGNDRPFTVTTENWMSQQLKMTILTVTHDPRSGDRTFKIANLSTTEPDPTMFMAPPDYSVVDEKDSFTIQYRGQ